MEYDVALSFAGEDRKYVEEVADELKKLKVSVFYDSFETVNLWGKDLYTHLQKVYQNQAKYTIIFISDYYAKKLWTNHERKMAQARAFTESREYILPARFDDTEIEGILPTTGFIDLRKFSAIEFSKLVINKISESNREELANSKKEKQESREALLTQFKLQRLTDFLKISEEIKSWLPFPVYENYDKMLHIQKHNAVVKEFLLEYYDESHYRFFIAKPVATLKTLIKEILDN